MTARDPSDDAADAPAAVAAAGAAGKAALRARVRAARRARAPQERAADAAALAAVITRHPLVRGAAVVAAYASTPTEPGTGPLRAALAAAGTAVLLPVVRGEGPLGWTDADGAARDLAEADVVLLPALAVDARGHRLGQGGGHYDRTLAELARRRPLPPLVALVHDDEVLAAGSVPREAHDAVVGAAATPARWVDLAEPAEPARPGGPGGPGAPATRPGPGRAAPRGAPSA